MTLSYVALQRLTLLYVDMEGNMPTVPFTVRIDTSLRKQLDKEAQQIDRTASYIATKAIASYLQRCENKRRAIDKAVKLADKGNFVSQESVDAWVESWGSDNELPMPKADILSD